WFHAWFRATLLQPALKWWMPMADLIVPLSRLAHARTGDKGDRTNISVIAWNHALYPLLVEQLTTAAVQALFAHRRPSATRRYLLPKLGALNFVMDATLDGGVNGALNLDAHGKALSYWMLTAEIAVPPHLAQYLAGPAAP